MLCGSLDGRGIWIHRFPGSSDGKVSACNAGDLGSFTGWGRSSGEGNGNLLQYSCLENSMDGGAWWATVHGVTKSQTRLSDFTSFLFICLDESFPCSPELSQHCYSGIVLVAHQCFRLSNPMGCSPQGSSVHGILQARILEWVAILFSRGSS